MTAGQGYLQSPFWRRSENPQAHNGQDGFRLHSRDLRQDLQHIQAQMPVFCICQMLLQSYSDLMVRGIKEIDHKVFMAYTREGTLDTLRVKALDCLIDLGALRNQALAPYICYVCDGQRAGAIE
jgi:hypothetical protein